MDDETQVSGSKYIWFASVTGSFPSVTLGSVQQAGFGTGNEIQPFYDATLGRLYFTENAGGSIASYSFSTSSNAALSGSFTSEKTELATDGSTTRTGAIASVGETSLAHPADGSTYLYFVYYKKTSTGFDPNVGRVKAQ